MNVSREAKHGTALAIIELDQPVSSEATALVAQVNGVSTVMSLPPLAVS